MSDKTIHLSLLENSHAFLGEANRVPDLLRDLLTEVVTLAEDFAADMHNVFLVGFVLGKDQRLRYQRSVREQFEDLAAALRPARMRFALSRKELMQQQ